MQSLVTSPLSFIFQPDRISASCIFADRGHVCADSPDCTRRAQHRGTGRRDRPDLVEAGGDERALLTPNRTRRGELEVVVVVVVVVVLLVVVVLVVVVVVLVFVGVGGGGVGGGGGGVVARIEACLPR